MIRKLKALVRPHLGTEIFYAIWVAERVYEEMGAWQFCITSLSDGRHMIGSRHFYGSAVDLRIWHLDVDKRKKAAELIQHRLGRYYFVLLEKDHMHIEYRGQ